jgi:hypothetical protein
VYAYGDDQRKSSEVRVKKSNFDFWLNPGTAPVDAVPFFVACPR